MAFDSRGAAETTPTLARYGRNFCSAVHNVTVVLTRFVAAGAEMLHGRRRQHRWYPSLRQRRQLCVVLLVEVFGAISGHVRRRQPPPVQWKLFTMNHCNSRHRTDEHYTTPNIRQACNTAQHLTLLCNTARCHNFSQLPASSELTA